MTIDKSATQLRDMMLRAVKQSYIDRGIAVPNVGRDSDLYTRFDAIAEVFSISLANSIEVKEDIFPETCSEEALLKHATSMGESKHEAETASGYIVMGIDRGPPPTYLDMPIVLDTTDQLVSDLGILYNVVQAQTVYDGYFVEISAVEPGISGNMDYLDKLKWVTPQTYMKSHATVGPLGISGGAEIETTEEFRDRISDRKKSPSIGCNPDHLMSIAESESAAIVKAFSYPALGGPASGMLVCMGDYNSDTRWTRVIPSIVLSAVASAIAEKMPAEVDISIVSVVEQNTGLSLRLTLPDPIASGGPGGGWIDATPFPNPTAADGYAWIAANTNASRINISSTQSGTPSIGDTIAVWNRYTQSFQKAKITTYHGKMGQIYDVTVDTAIADLSIGNYVSPGASNMDDYASGILTACAKMGPGEATSDANRLPRARRRPEKEVSWYHAIYSRLWSDLLKTHPEIADIELGVADVSEPTVPSMTSPLTAPNVIVINQIAFYPA